MTRKLRHLGYLVALLGLGTTSCRHLKPWERAKLAHPTMIGAGGAGAAEDHMYAVQEGAVGGGAAIESGCGCN